MWQNDGLSPFCSPELPFLISKMVAKPFIQLPQSVFMLWGENERGLLIIHDHYPTLGGAQVHQLFWESWRWKRDRDSGFEGKRINRIKMADSSRIGKAQNLHVLGSGPCRV